MGIALSSEHHVVQSMKSGDVDIRQDRENGHYRSRGWYIVSSLHNAFYLHKDAEVYNGIQVGGGGFWDAEEEARAFFAEWRTMQPGAAIKLFRDQAVTIAKRGREVHLICDSPDESHELFEWLCSLGKQSSFATQRNP